nr:kelch protein 18 [Hymenolepis microstoma]
MQITPESRYFDDDLLSKYADRFNVFRQEMTFIDLSILTKGGTTIPAHKIVLCARFPGIKNSILNSGQSNFSNWSRFPHDIVMAVVDFAYTGEIIINAENVLGIYLMAHNLGCNKLINWTTDFIKTRFDRLKLMEVWLAGNVTSNNDLIGACIPRIASDFERLASSQCFFQHVGVEQFQILLQSTWICDGNEATKFKALQTWFHATSLTDEQSKREKSFHRLLELINLNKLPKELVIETSMNESYFNLSENARRTFLDKVLKLTGFARTKTPIWVHVRNGGARSGALRAVPEISGETNSSFPFIYRFLSYTVALDGWVYTLGGINDSDETISIVERINPLNGEVTVLQPMIEERNSHSAVARGHAILVFGGYSSRTDNVTGSCEEFIPATNTWKKLPQMPTPRSSTGAAHIPGVGEIVVGGIKKTEDGEWVDVDNAEIYLTNSSPLGYAGSWCEIAPTLNSRCRPSAEFLNGKVYVAGDLANSTSSVEMLSIFTEGPPQWTELTDNSFRPCSMISFEGSLLFATEDGKIYELQFNQDDENPSRQKYSWKLISELDHISSLRLLKDEKLKQRYSDEVEDLKNGIRLNFDVLSYLKRVTKLEEELTELTNKVTEAAIAASSPSTATPAVFANKALTENVINCWKLSAITQAHLKDAAFYQQFSMLFHYMANEVGAQIDRMIGLAEMKLLLFSPQGIVDEAILLVKELEVCRSYRTGAYLGADMSTHRNGTPSEANSKSTCTSGRGRTVDTSSEMAQNNVMVKALISFSGPDFAIRKGEDMIPIKSENLNFWSAKTTFGECEVPSVIFSTNGPNQAEEIKATGQH